MNKLFSIRTLRTSATAMLAILIGSVSADNLGDYAGHVQEGSGFVFTTTTGQKVRLRPYTDYMIRVQAAKSGNDFYPDNRYEMVEKHAMGGTLTLSDKGDAIEVVTGAADGIKVRIAKKPMRLEFSTQQGAPLLKDKGGITWTSGKFGTDFVYDDVEHFCGLGHEGWIGQQEWMNKKIEAQELSIDLKGKQIQNYTLMGLVRMPFYLSHKGYGVFYNIMYPWFFSFNSTRYGADFTDISSNAEIDYFFIFGPEFGKILDRYTQLTGRPRLPPLAQFGLAMSQHEPPDPKNADWWKSQITQMRNLGKGYGFDHAVMDNDWRPGHNWGSEFTWDAGYYPDPAGFAKWLKENGVVLTMDLNRNNVVKSWGWNASYNIPGQSDWPDYTNKTVKTWIWDLFWKVSYDPALKYPGDAIWLDEMETMDGGDNVQLSNGRLVGELRNYTSFLVGKAVCGEGWDNEEGGTTPGIGEAKRPWIWTRSACPGAQRYITSWTGDIPFTYLSMKGHVTAMLRSGLGGFPYFNHDAGGFHKRPNEGVLTDDIYKQWLSAWGSFTPIWRPHGYDAQRWPQRRTAECQEVLQRYNQLRYEMMPYIYTYAYQAHATGMPMARAMAIDYQSDENAWKHDFQYLWGAEMLVAPNCSGEAADLSIWLPQKWNWYDYWTDKLHEGGKVITYRAEPGVLPILVHEGSIIPRYPFAKSTVFLDRSKLFLHVYPGKDGSFQLYEDDGVTEKFRTKNEKRTTAIWWKDKSKTLVIDAAQGSFTGAPAKREYFLYVHASTENAASVNNAPLNAYATEDEVKAAGAGVTVRSAEKIVVVYTGKFDVTAPLSIHIGPPSGVAPAPGMAAAASWALRRVSPNAYEMRTASAGRHAIRISDLSGKTVASLCGTGPATYLWKSRAGGVYFIRSSQGGGNVRTERVTVWR